MVLLVTPVVKDVATAQMEAASRLVTLDLAENVI